MKNFFMLFVFMSFSVFVNAQSDESSMLDAINKKATSALSITVHFKDIADLKRFKTQKLVEGDFLEKLTIKSNLTFTYTLGEPTQLENSKEDVYGLKIEIKDQDSREDLFKELTDSIDGIISLYEEGYISK